MQSFHKAYKRNAFSTSNPCPVSFDIIEKYMQILLPAFQFNLIMQQTQSSIGDVIPALKIIISKWRRFNFSGVYKDLCMKLVQSFEAKFQYELNSHVYQVASLLETNKLRVWLNREDCADIRTSAFANVCLVYNSFEARESKVGASDPDPRRSDEEDELEYYFNDDSYTKVNGSSSGNVELGNLRIYNSILFDC
jgi:hypothetical protein